jgi:hypothetical protein
MQDARASEIAQMLVSAYNARQPLMIHGKPGIGKSSIVHQFAAMMKKKYPDFKIIDKRICTMEPVDWTGLPWFDDEFSNYKTWRWLPQDGHGLLFLDEFAQGILATQNAASQLILDRRIGDYILPEGWSIVLASNQKTDKAGIVELASHMKSRLVHVRLIEDLADFVTWAEESKEIIPEVIHFLQFRQNLLCEFKPDDMAYPCPRTWHFVSKLVEQCRKDKQPHHVMQKFVCGAVGNGAGTEFIGFLKNFEALPEIAVIFSNPSKAKVFKEASVNTVLALLLARRVKAETMESLTIYLDRCEPEMAVKCVTDAVKHNAELKKTDAYKAWEKKYKNVTG